MEESGVRLANAVHVLRELVHLSCGWLALEPRLEVKCALSDHLHDDARAITGLTERLEELGGDPGAPVDELAALLDRASSAQAPDAYLRVAYGELKPALIGAIGVHLDRLDPLLDRPLLGLLTQVRHRQERHVVELADAPGPPPPDGDLGAAPPRPGARRELRVLAPLEQPARDAYVRIVEDAAAAPDAVPVDREAQPRFFHDRLHAALCSAELLARSAHEHPDLPWAFHADLARLVADDVRHAEVHDRLMTAELGCRWGAFPVDFGAFRAAYARDLRGRLAPAEGSAPDPAAWRASRDRAALVEQGQETVARVVDHLLVDGATRERTLARWREASPPSA